MKKFFENGVLTIFVDGRFDAYNSDKIGKEIDEIIISTTPEKIVLDFCDLEYIASAGLRVLLKIGKEHKDLSVINVTKEVYEVLEMTGFNKLFTTHRKMREISVEGCKVIGAGFSSNVYRYDRETIVKLFSERITLDRIYSETESAKKSFVAGIPTAIPYDVVKCGNNYGTVFELIDADTLSQNFMDHPERFDELMDKYIVLLKKFHSTPAIKGMFPDIKSKYHTWIDGLKKYVPEEELAPLHTLIDAVPDRQKMIHVDCHSRNIMVAKDNLVFVDMADVSIGHPLFDIGAEYYHYIIMRETSLGASVIFGVEPEDEELPVRVWKELVNRYFGETEQTRVTELNKMLKYFGCLRCLIMVAKHAHIEYDVAMELINKQRKELYPYIPEAIELFKKADEYFVQ